MILEFLRCSKKRTISLLPLFFSTSLELCERYSLIVMRLLQRRIQLPLK
jgi:hypothetical protein